MRSTTPPRPTVGRAELVEPTPRFLLRVLATHFALRETGTSGLRVHLLVEHAPAGREELRGSTLTIFTPLEGPGAGEPIRGLVSRVFTHCETHALMFDRRELLGVRLSAEVEFEQVGRVLEPRLRDVRRVL